MKLDQIECALEEAFRAAEETQKSLTLVRDQKINLLAVAIQDIVVAIRKMRDASSFHPEQ